MNDTPCLLRTCAPLLLLSLLALPTACSEGHEHDDTAPSLSVADALGDGRDPSASAGFARATEVPELRFPRDHGPHPEFRTEWWYVTANVDTPTGRRFGVELVFFRQGLRAEAAERAASLAAHELVLAHAAVTDVDGERFVHAERMARRGGGLASITETPTASEPLHIRCDDWAATAEPGDPNPATAGLLPLTLTAGDGDTFSFSLRVEPGKPMVLQGDRGLSRKSDEPGNASIYYSLTRLPIAGAVTVGGERHDVAGLAWIDREWSTSALGQGQVGWDWFSLQLDDGTELMWYRLRRADGSTDRWSRGALVATDGSVTPLDAQQVTATPSGTWNAPDGRAAYPARWRLRCDRPAFDLEVVPLLPDQELQTLVRYWEGAVGVSGTRGGAAVRGRGYLEMTGYAR